VLNDRYDYSVTELSVCLRIRADDFECLRKAHQSRALPRREPAWSTSAGTDQNLRPVFVIPRAQRPRYIIGAEQAKAKAVTSGPVLRGVLAQVSPKMGTEDILLLVFGLENAPKGGAADRDRRKSEVFAAENAPSNTDDDDALAVLRNPRPSVNDRLCNVIAQLI